MQRKIAFSISKIDRFSSGRIQKELENIRTSITLTIDHGQVHRSLSLVILGGKTLWKCISKDLEDLGVTSVGTSIVHGKHTSAIGKFRCSTVTKETNVPCHDFWVVSVSGGVEMKRSTVLVVLNEFTLGISVDKDLQHIGRSSVGTGMMQRQPAMSVSKTSNLWSGINKITHQFRWWIIELAHKMEACNLSISTNVGSRSTPVLTFVCPEPFSNLVPGLINDFVPVFQFFCVHQKSFIRLDDSIFQNLEKTLGSLVLLLIQSRNMGCQDTFCLIRHS
mmetsp:Transcript_3596/g.8211  ORF Transcript_3596/g.8211 Transcript_3596/m.8211 type:complete len:277 (-) Transcript_3596:178-1008(-)